MRQLQTSINPNYIPLSRLSMDLKVMPRSHKGHKFILCIIDEVTNYLITVPIYQAKWGDRRNTYRKCDHKNIAFQSISLWIETAFMSTLMTYLLNKSNIKIRTVAPHNHESIQAEHSIKSLLTILTKHLNNLSQMWPKYLPLAMFAYNMFNTPKLGNCSPYELIYGRKPKPLLN